MTALKLDHVTLLVTSFEASIPYYDVLLPLLGFTKEREHVWYDGSGFYLQFGEAEVGTRPYERSAPGMNHLGFAAPDIDTVECVGREMSKAGFSVPNVQHLGEATALFMKDPDGIRFELTYHPTGAAVID